MKILLATSAIIPTGGGIASYNQELLSSFKENNTFSVLTDENIYDYNGIEKVISTFNHNPFSYEYSRFLVNEINENNYDVIINSNSLALSIITPYLKTPIISISHFVNGKLAITAGHNANFISKIIVLSHYGKMFEEKTYNILDQEKISVVYNFVHSEDDIMISKQNRNTIKIVYPGGTSIKKSFELVMMALRKLIKTDLNFEFLWLGDLKLPSAKFCFAKNLTELIKKDYRVTFTGKLSRQEAVEQIKSANIFLLPSRGEGCPMTLLEAMQTGCIPIVSDAKHGSREILEDGKFGIIILNEDYESIYNSLCNVLLNHEKYMYNYDKTYKYVNKVLSETVWRNKMETIIKDSISREKKSQTLTKKDFKKNINKLKFSLFKDRVKTILASIRSCIYSNYMFFSK